MNGDSKRRVLTNREKMRMSYRAAVTIALSVLVVAEAGSVPDSMISKDPPTEMPFEHTEPPLEYERPQDAKRSEKGIMTTHENASVEASVEKEEGVMNDRPPLDEPETAPAAVSETKDLPVESVNLDRDGSQDSGQITTRAPLGRWTSNKGENAMSDKPGSSNTGPREMGALEESASLVIDKEGAVIENVRVRGSVRIKASNVTLRNFVIDASGLPWAIKTEYGLKNVVLEDGEAFGADTIVTGDGINARRLNIHDAGGDGFVVYHDSIIEDSWVHHLGKNDGAHADGVQVAAGSNLIFRRNNFDMPRTDPAPYKSNAAFFVNSAAGHPISDVLIEDNWINGGAYSVKIGVGTSGVIVRNNLFGRDFGAGPMNIKSGVVWENNRYEDNGDVINK